jgi:predicted RNA binding protein YcfA (HicA-like mRNA interferase family)
MSKRDKLIEKLKNSPNNATFAQIEKLLIQENFVLERVTGSHHVFKKSDLIFVVPVHKNKVKAVYVKRVIELIEEENNAHD